MYWPPIVYGMLKKKSVELNKKLQHIKGKKVALTLFGVVYPTSFMSKLKT